jgi:hypothetical protein
LDPKQDAELHMMLESATKRLKSFAQSVADDGHTRITPKEHHHLSKPFPATKTTRAVCAAVLDDNRQSQHWSKYAYEETTGNEIEVLYV